MRVDAALACCVLAPLVAAASRPLELQPSSKWVVAYAENSCRLVRQFGEGGNKTTLGLESDAPGETDMLVIGHPLRTFAEQVQARFLPMRGKPFGGRPARATDRGEPAVLFPEVHFASDTYIEAARKETEERRAHPAQRPAPLNLAEEEMKKADRQKFAAETTSVEIDTGTRAPVILETGSLAQPFSLFQKCLRDSLRDWGVDPQIEDKIVRPAWPSEPPRNWFSPDDYPRMLIARGAESIVKARLIVDAAGRVTKCTSLSHFEEAEFNEVVCRNFMAHAHFEPAELADGTKVPSYYVTSVVFRIGH